MGTQILLLSIVLLTQGRAQKMGPPWGERPTIAALIPAAELVVRGRPVEIHSVRVNGETEYEVVTVSIEEVFKGDPDTLPFAYVDGQLVGGKYISVIVARYTGDSGRISPKYRRGSDYLFFLRRMDARLYARVEADEFWGDLPATEERLRAVRDARSKDARERKRQ